MCYNENHNTNTGCEMWPQHIIIAYYRQLSINVDVNFYSMTRRDLWEFKHVLFKLTGPGKERDHKIQCWLCL